MNGSHAAMVILYKLNIVFLIRETAFQNLFLKGCLFVKHSTKSELIA